jgi:hypothetical protein
MLLPEINLMIPQLSRRESTLWTDWVVAAVSWPVWSTVYVFLIVILYLFTCPVQNQTGVHGRSLWTRMCIPSSLNIVQTGTCVGMSGKHTQDELQSLVIQICRTARIWRNSDISGKWMTGMLTIFGRYSSLSKKFQGVGKIMWFFHSSSSVVWTVRCSSHPAETCRQKYRIGGDLLSITFVHLSSKTVNLSNE